MAQLDSEQEKRRLAAFYSEQLDGELEKVATEAYELTDLAREVLRTELVKRGLNTELTEHAPVAPVPPALPGDPPVDAPPEIETSETEDGVLESRKLVTIRSFRDLPEALLAQGCLESAGIDACLADDNMVRTDWFWSNAVGGVKLQVDSENVDEANAILEQPIPEGFEVPGVGEYQQPRCPKCQSLDITFQELDKPVAYMSAYLHVPIPVHGRAWRCRSCFSEWEETEEQMKETN
jgi:hypothetical protein